MILTIPFYEFNIDYVNFGFQIKNTTYKNYYYYNIIYSKPKFNLSNLYIKLDFNYYHIEYDKITFNIKTHQTLIDTIRNIEINILDKIDLPKRPVYKLFKQLQKGSFTFYSLENHHYTPYILIKLIGIWENENEYGLVYKFYASSSDEET